MRTPAVGSGDARTSRRRDLISQHRQLPNDPGAKAGSTEKDAYVVAVPLYGRLAARAGVGECRSPLTGAEADAVYM